MLPHVRAILSSVILAALVAVDVALFVYYLQAAVITQPYWDMLSIVTRYLQYVRDGNLASYVWEPHVQHRHVWIRLLTMLDARVWQGVGYPFVVTAAACLLTAAGVLWTVARQTVTGPAGVWLASLITMLVLTSVAAVDCAIPINGIYPQALMFTVLAIVLFDAGDAVPARQRHWRRGLALLMAMAAAFGNAAALSVWVILVWQAWRTRAGRIWLAVVSVIGALFVTVYVRGLPAAAGAGAAIDWPRAADYLVTYLGLPWTRSAALAAVGTLLGVILLIVGVACVVGIGLLRRDISRSQRIGVALVAFTLATAVLAALGRADVDADLRVPVRYSVFVAPMHVGLLLLAWPGVCRVCAGPRRAGLYWATVAVSLVLVVQQVGAGRAAVATTDSMRTTLQRFAAGEETDDMTRVVYVDLAQARRDLDAIHAAGLYLHAR